MSNATACEVDRWHQNEDVKDAKWVLYHGLQWGELVEQGYTTILVQSIQGQDWAAMRKEED